MSVEKKKHKATGLKKIETLENRVAPMAIAAGLVHSMSAQPTQALDNGSNHAPVETPPSAPVAHEPAAAAPTAAVPPAAAVPAAVDPSAGEAPEIPSSPATTAPETATPETTTPGTSGPIVVVPPKGLDFPVGKLPPLDIHVQVPRLEVPFHIGPYPEPDPLPLRDQLVASRVLPGNLAAIDANISANPNLSVIETNAPTNTAAAGQIPVLAGATHAPVASAVPSLNGITIETPTAGSASHNVLNVAATVRNRS